MRLTAVASIQNNTWRHDPSTGFLRCTASILRSGIMEYTRDDLAGADIPDTVGDVIRIYVPSEELADPDSMRTLEGMPAVVGHTWQLAGAMSACGNVCGSPAIQGDHLIADILITDPDVAKRVMLPEGNPSRLQEISSAGDWVIVWEPGTAPDGQPYDARFTRLTYNHVALLPAGAGRAGSTVRIINEKEAIPMEYTRIQIRNKKTGKTMSVRVANEDVARLEETLVENEEIINEAISPEQLEKAIEELKALRDETKAKNDRIAELEGMIKAYQEQLEQALSSEAVEAAAAEMTAEMEEATAVLNSVGLAITPEVKKMRGHALRTSVLNSVRVKNGKSELAEADAKDESLVRGMFRALVDIGGMATRRIPGAEVVSTTAVQNSAVTTKTATMTSAVDRLQRMYGTTEGK